MTPRPLPEQVQALGATCARLAERAERAETRLALAVEGLRRVKLTMGPLSTAGMAPVHRDRLFKAFREVNDALAAIKATEFPAGVPAPVRDGGGPGGRWHPADPPQPKPVAAESGEAP